MAKKECKYCNDLCVECELEGLQCLDCKLYVHIKCLKRGAVPGGLIGDIFFEYNCSECSSSGSELFVRDKMPWLQAILLTLYHMQKRCSGVARKGYFHWKLHIASFIYDQWNTLFRKDFKRKKNWIGTISGTLSHYSPLFFKSGTEIFNEQGWWALSLPTLTPHCAVKLNAEMVLEKQRRKDLKLPIDEIEMLKEILSCKPYFTENLLNFSEVTTNSESCLWDSSSFESKFTVKEKKKTLLPAIRNRYNFGENNSSKPKSSNVDLKPKKRLYSYQTLPEPKHVKSEIIIEPTDKPIVPIEFKKEVDFLYHFNTVIQDVSLRPKLTLKEKLVGGLQSDLIYSSYSHRFMSPYIYRFTEMNPRWLQLMDEFKCKVNQNDEKWKLPPRAPLDFVYIQASHIPAINSLCNQFFWSGIDVSDVLEYPEFSCVVLYRKLVVAFALLTPDVNINESYLSFIFTRPNWRNCGIAKIMLYHLTQANTGRDLTLHVSKNSKALLLYNKFSFKIEHVVQDFYDRYLRDDTAESKHAYFCRLSRFAIEMPVQLGFKAKEIVAEGRVTNDDIKQIKIWLNEQKNVPVISDEEIVNFLISNDKNQEKTKSTINAFFKIRNEGPDIFNNRLSSNENSVAYFGIAPKRTKDNCAVIFARIYDTRFRWFNLAQYYKSLFMTLDAAIYSKPASGLIMVMDMDGYGIMHLTKLRPSTISIFFRYLQEALPVKLKNIHVLNTAYFIDKVMVIIKPFMSDHLNQQILFHNREMNMDEFFETYVAKELLPKDFGGELPCMKDLNDQLIKKFQSMEGYFKAEEDQRYLMPS